MAQAEATTQVLAETAAEIAAEIPKWTWELMDEEQRDAFIDSRVFPRYMAETSDGITLGPTWWAEAVGATAEAIRGRVQRLRRSQNSDDEKRSRALLDSRMRHARSALREAPMEEVERIISDLPLERQRNIANAIEETHPAVQKKPPLGVPEPNVSLTMAMAGPMRKLREAVDEGQRVWERNADEADEQECADIRDEWNELVAKATAAVTDWSIR